MQSTKASIPVSIATMLLLFTLAPAQELPGSKKSRGGSGYFMLGWNRPKIDALASSLRAGGYPAFNDEVVSYGAGGHLSFNRLLLGGEGHALKNSNGSVTLPRGDYATTLEAAYGFLTVGYLVIPQDRFQLYPMLGLGGGGLKLKIVTKSAASFEEVLREPARNAELSNGGLLINLALGADSWLGIHRERRDLEGIVFGLRAGYVLTTIAGDWYLYEEKISGGPKYDFSGPYVRLLVGVGAVASQ